MNKRIIKILTVFIELFIGMTAILGGFGLIASDGLGTPVSWLNGYFPSYFIPGLFLIFVGIINFLAAWTLSRNFKHQYEFSTSAGFGIIIFEFFELYIMLHSHFLQIFYLILGIIILVSTMHLIRSNHD